MSPSTIKQALKKISLAVAALLVGLVIAELTLRLFSPRYYPIIPAAYEYDPETAFRLRSNTHLFKTTDHQQENLANPLGMANFQDDFNDYERLIFAIGDSYTQGTGVPADMSYPVQLDLMLNQDAHGFYTKKYGVVNLGVAGYGGEQSLLNLKRWGKRLKPPAIILYLGCDNDFEDDQAFNSGDRHGIVIAGSPVWGGLTKPLRLLVEDTQIGLLTRAAYRQRVRVRLVNNARRSLGEKTSVAELELSVIERLKAYADENNSKLIVSWSDAGESYRWLQQWSSQNGVAFADWVPKAESVRQVMPKLTLDNQHSGGHHRGWLNQIIAREYARQIRIHEK